MFKLFKKQYQLDHKALARARTKADLSIKQFALLCGWSYAYQWNLENGHVETVSEETKNVIEDVLKEYNDDGKGKEAEH